MSIGKIEWEEIFKKLKGWRKETLKTIDKKTAKPLNQDPIVSIIAEEYKEEPEQKPWAVLASTILSLRTTDEVTTRTSRSLLARAPTPQKLLKLSVEEISRLIYPAGFYKTKAASLKKIAEILIKQYKGLVPSDMDALLALPGVGRKTANLVLIEAFDQYGICVDIHVHRISNRTGWVKTTSPEKTEEALRQILPKKYWKVINNLLVFYGQKLCRPLSPHCSRCVIPAHCLKINVNKSR